MNMKTLSVLMIFLIAILAMSNTTKAWDENNVTFDVEVDGTTLTSGITVLDLERGNDFEVRVEMVAGVNLSDAQLEASLAGIHNDEVRDITGTFDMVEGVTYVKRLSLELPEDMDEDLYTLRVTLEDRYDEGQVTYDIKVDTSRNDVVIKDTILSPGEEIRQGRTMITNVRVKNMGQQDEEGVKVTFSISELGLSDSTYLEDDELLVGDSKTTDDLLVRIPDCAETKGYVYDVEVEFDNGDAETTESGMIYVTEGDLCGMTDETPSTTVTIGPASQDVKQGSTAIYPLTLTNVGSEAKSYVIGTDGTDGWGVVTMDPSTAIVLQAGETKTSYISIVANNDATEGEHMFTVSITTGVDLLKEVALEANVLENEKGDFKKGLEIGLIVLVILLVILGLIVGFNKLKGDEEESEDVNGETYY